MDRRGCVGVGIRTLKKGGPDVTNSAGRAGVNAEEQMLEIQARSLGVANLARREGDTQTARDMLAICDLMVQITTRHAMRSPRP